MSEQFNVFFRQVLVARQFVIIVTPVAAFLIVWGWKRRVNINGNLERSMRIWCQDVCTVVFVYTHTCTHTRNVHPVNLDLAFLVSYIIIWVNTLATTYIYVK